MCRGDQVIVLDLQIVNGDDGQVELKRLPVEPVVEGDIDAGFGTGVQQTAPRRIFADDACEDIRRQAIGDGDPVAAIVVGLEKVGREVVMLISIGGEVGDRRVMRRGLRLC